MGELASFSKGRGYSKSDLVHKGSPVILYGRLYTKYETTIKEVDTFVEQKPNSIISQGNEVIVPASGETSEDISRASVVLNSGIIFGGDLNIIKVEKTVNPTFLALTISNGKQQKELSRRAQGKSVVHIRNSDLINVDLKYPKIEEQNKIDELFKTLNNTIALHQRKLELWQKIKQGFLQNMFPQKEEKVPEVRFANFVEEWKQRKLGGAITSYSGGTPSVGNKSYYGGNIPFIRSAEINSDNTELFITNDGLINSSAKMVEVGDILYALYGATSGEVGISRINGAINQAILAIKSNDGYESQFIMQWLRLQKQKIIDKYLQGGQGNLSGSIVKSLQIDFPSIEEQKKIGSFFKQLDTTIAFHQNKMEELEMLKKAFLQKIFI